MPRRNWVMLAFFAAGLAVVVTGGLLQHIPAYMDAQYYYAGAIALADGKGFYLPVAWNYLDDPVGLPAPSHTFWMPLTSLLLAPGYALFHDYTGARWLLWLVAAFIPPATVHLGLRLHGRIWLAVVGGLFALFPAFYAVYMPAADAFALYMLLGYVFFLALDWRWKRHDLQPLAFGALAGVMYLARADGLFWLAGALAWISLRAWREEKTSSRLARWFISSLICGTAFMAITSAWYLRNLVELGSLLPPGNSHALWLTRYEDLFIYPAELLTPARWLAQGFPAILRGMGGALMNNLQTAIAVQGSIALFPFILIGLFALRKQPGVCFFSSMWGFIFLIFTLVFPYQGINGSFFHAGAAFQVLFWAVAPVGVEIAVLFIAKLRKWQRGKQVQRFVEVLLSMVCLVLSLGLTVQHLGGSEQAAGWNDSLAIYQTIDARLAHLGAAACDRVMVNNPPAYHLASGRTAVVIPFGDEAMLRSAAKEYEIRFLVLSEDNSGHLPDLYTNLSPIPGFRYLETVGDARLYEFDQ